uniref:Ras modification protein ERF4 n=1 Tax=Angiostrongylus cantonensis TaxID=6313 RepID=A0A0K0CYD8_ANGCA
MVVASPPQPLTKNGVAVHEMRTIQMESCRKIFIPRDYSQGLNVHFETHFPMAFRTWESTIHSINSIFAEAEKVCFATILETLLGCATCYCSRLISDTIYQKKMKTLSEFIDQENQQTYNPAGFHIISPMQRGLRTVFASGKSPSDPHGLRLLVVMTIWVLAMLSSGFQGTTVA